MEPQSQPHTGIFDRICDTSTVSATTATYGRFCFALSRRSACSGGSTARTCQRGSCRDSQQLTRHDEAAGASGSCHRHVLAACGA